MNPNHKQVSTENDNELSSFAKAFSSEKQLIKALAELLRKMGRKGVQILHGPQEHGKDIVFYSRGGFQERRLYACVIKNSKLSGQMNSDSGTRTVFHQAESAFDTPFTTSKGHSEYVESVYVITPYECSPTAISAIKSKLKSRSGQVTFLFGSELFGLFLDYWPDFIIFESGTLSKYLSDLPRSFSKDTALTVLLRRYSLLSKTIKPLPQIYVQRDFDEILIEYFTGSAKWPHSKVFQKSVDLKDLKKIREKLEWYESFVKAVSQGRKDENLKEFNIFYDDYETRWRHCWEKYEKPILDLRNKYEKKRRDEYEKKKENYKNKYPFHPSTEADFSRVEDKDKINYLKIEQESEIKLFLDHKNFLTKRYESLRRKSKNNLDNVSSMFENARRYVKEHNISNNNDAVETFEGYREIQRISQYIPTQVETRLTSKLLQSDRDLLNSGLRAILITGPAGFGKTSFCKWHALQDANEYLDGTGHFIPIYIQLHAISPNKEDTFEKAFIEREDLRNILSKTAINKERTFRFYLDGLDEVPESSRRREIMLLAWNAYLKHTNIQIIVTTREHIVGDYLNWLRRFKLANLSDTQVDRLVSNWLDEDESRIFDFHEQLKKMPSLKRIMRVPLLGTLIIAVFKRTRSLPQNRIQLYKLFVELQCGGWDLVKNVKRDSKFGYHDKELILTRLAGRLHYNNKRDGNTSDFKMCVKEVFPGLTDNWTDFLDDVLQDGLLVPMGSRLIFSHLSFQEFLAAKFLAEPEGYRASTILNMYFRGNEWWKEVLTFYVGMYSRPSDIVKWLKKHRNIVSSGIGDDMKLKIEKRYNYLIKSLETFFPSSITY